MKDNMEMQEMKTNLSPDVPRASHKAAQEATPANDLPHQHTQSTQSKKTKPKRETQNKAKKYWQMINFKSVKRTRP